MLQIKVVEKIKTHFMFNNFLPKIKFFTKQYEKNTLESNRLQVTIQYARALCVLDN
jgi:hypothetical protein